ncbi:MAG: helix-turn-helix domain-containing protein [Chloroflexota bacterium]|jgi:DNA-binding transcriptional ArsR family regulator|nr:helix-turn-helix domain-containing protein [Chloroflexota bacterium]
MNAQPPSNIHLDARALKVLAHPLRTRLLAALRMDGPATATALAETLGTNTGATSYHLRRLASVGLVEETDQGRGRERWWRAATEMHNWTERDVADDPQGRAATDWLRRATLSWFLDRYQAWLDTQASWPLDWQDVSGGSDFALSLTPARLAAFQAEFQAMFERYHAATPETDDAEESAETVLIYLHTFPVGATK